MKAVALKRKRSSLDLETKYRIIQEVVENKRKYKEVVSMFGLKGLSHVSEIVRNKDRIVKEYQTKTCSERKSLKTTPYKDVENALIDFIRCCNKEGIPVTGPILQEKAKEIASKLGHQHLKGTRGFIQRFRDRNKVIFAKSIRGKASPSLIENGQKLQGFIVPWNNRDDIEEIICSPSFLEDSAEKVPLENKLVSDTSLFKMNGKSGNTDIVNKNVEPDSHSNERNKSDSSSSVGGSTNKTCNDLKPISSKDESTEKKEEKKINLQLVIQSLDNLRLYVNQRNDSDLTDKFHAFESALLYNPIVNYNSITIESKE
ncbi:tigger transposable element-derived protein 4-like protein [Dinothrombium tinctorium]|uniref:Tigger transposable element-derived protein 4-like protein n=1 Tax=Dinothrombium tinctorium TaxID=1965070 RepID=A0A3S3P7P5_9ACAR|nr:tigger transposable element-derived protein 4-like protein [Dinothrombium tinctorium]RWS05393.1 tigger transposable element-derived protein 4-like protein [Dinothrombium tinctorium]RWS13954.1 tigger transposable element-derived protein 4-like protein [Dinothrombium tinctorium]